MACELKICYLVLLFSLTANLRSSVHAEPQVPCYFILGDSLLDNGNNNDLQTTAKVNHPPYGIDFPSGPTGRFSNGRNLPDYIARFLGFGNSMPPYATARDSDIMTGVNYASGGAGILDETGKQLGERIALKKQLRNHRRTRSRIAALLGSKEAAVNHLSKCMYSVGMGSNDYLNNYLKPKNYNSSRLYTPDQYAAVLINQYSGQLRTLYRYGARKFAISGLGPIGCAPAVIAIHGTNGSTCVDSINGYVQLFNVRLKSLIDELNKDLSDAKFIYLNLTEISSGSSLAAGTVISTPCCVVSPATGQCTPNTRPCNHRKIHEFWDGFHPSEITNLYVATRYYTALTPLDAYPMDIRHLAQL